MVEQPIFAIDSKRHIRVRENTDKGETETFIGLLGVCVNPHNIGQFEEQYDSIMNDLFKLHGLERTRMVYKSYDIARLFKKDFEKEYKAFLIGFAREVLNLESLKTTFFFTEINTKYLENGKIKIFGKYGGPTKEIGVEQFMNILSGYYEIICAWKIQEITTIRNAIFIVDGLDALYPSKAWEELHKRNNILIHFKGDQINPLLSTSDLLIKFLELFLKERYSPLNENKIERVLSYDGKVDMKNVFIKYIGNPDIENIKPLENYRMDFNDLQEHIQRPLIFVGLSDLKGQKSLFEESPSFDKLLKMAIGLNASVRFFNPDKDAKLIGKHSTPDYFIPLCKTAEDYFEFLKRSGCNIEKLEIK